jgi:hypothetical protein
MGHALAPRRRLDSDHELVIDMSRFSERERERIMAEAVANLRRRDEAEVKRKPAPPVLNHEWQLPEQQEPEPPRGLDTAPIDWSSIIDRRVAAAVAAVRAEMLAEVETSRAFVLEIVGEAMGQVWATQREDAATELRDVKTALAEVERTLGEVARTLAQERARVLDLPALPRRSSDLN